MATGSDDQKDDQVDNQEVVYFPVSKNVRMHVSFQPELQVPAHIEEEVDRLWDRAQLEKEVYNNTLFCLASRDEDRIIGKFVEYRYYMAMHYNPELQQILDIYPLGVSGIAFCDDKVLVGVRDAKLALYPGFLELVPSGSIEPRAYMHNEVDFIMQLMWELEEEARLSEKKVQEVHPLGLFYSRDVGLYDLGLVIRLKLEDFEKSDLESTEEYPLLRWMKISDWQNVLADPKSQVVPLSRALWQVYQKQQGLS